MLRLFIVHIIIIVTKLTCIRYFPLLLSLFFSADPSECITSKKKARGSMRVLVTGWGNLAGSDLRNMNKTQKYQKGVGRYANIESRWRDYVSVKSTKKLDKCGEGWQVEEPKKLSQPVGILSSNIRTFGFVEDMKKCQKDFCLKKSGCECPKVSGLDMKKPFGMEIRIFDHFHSKHLLDLMRILVYLAENSRNHKCTKYVYTKYNFCNCRVCRAIKRSFFLIWLFFQSFDSFVHHCLVFIILIIFIIHIFRLILCINVFKYIENFKTAHKSHTSLYDSCF